MNRVSIRPTFPHLFAFTFRCALCVCCFFIHTYIYIYYLACFDRCFLHLIIFWILRAEFFLLVWFVCFIWVRLYFHLRECSYIVRMFNGIAKEKSQLSHRANAEKRQRTQAKAEISKNTRYSIPAQRKSVKWTKMTGTKNKLNGKWCWCSFILFCVFFCCFSQFPHLFRRRRHHLLLLYFISLLQNRISHWKKEREMRKYLVVTFFMLLMQNSCVFLMQGNFLHFYFVLCGGRAHPFHCTKTMCVCCILCVCCLCALFFFGRTFFLQTFSILFLLLSSLIIIYRTFEIVYWSNVKQTKIKSKRNGIREWTSEHTEYSWRHTMAYHRMASNRLQCRW